MGGSGALLWGMVAVVALMAVFFVATGRPPSPPPSGFAAGAASAASVAGAGPPNRAWGAPPRPGPYGDWPPSPACGHTCSVHGAPPDLPPCGPGANPQWRHSPHPGGDNMGVCAVDCGLGACDTDGARAACLRGVGPARQKCVGECSAKTPYNPTYPQSWAACWNARCGKNHCHGMVDNDPACASTVDPARLGPGPP